MYALNTSAVFVRNQVKKFPALHRRLTDFIYADIVKHHPPVLSKSETIEIIVRDNARPAKKHSGRATGLNYPQKTTHE